MRIGVIVARFQIDDLHIGHTALIEHARVNNDIVIIVLGCSEVYYNTKNPLTFEIRRDMVWMFSTVDKKNIVPLFDHIDNNVWVSNLDSLIQSKISADDTVTLYGSRDSFISVYKKYHGKFYTEHFEELKDISATSRRASIKNTVLNNSSFRTGIIHAVENRFPTAYLTVDIAILKQEPNGDILLLLAKKPNRTKYCFPGGFVDPNTDSSLEDAAKRELSEEVLNIETKEMHYISSHKINDLRYIDTQDGIITSLFCTWWISGIPEVGDDLIGGEVSWFDINKFNPEIISDNHRILFDSLITKKIIR